MILLVVFCPFETYFGPVIGGSLNFPRRLVCMCHVFRAGTYSHEQLAVSLTTLGEFRSVMTQDFRLIIRVPYVALIRSSDWCC